MSKEIIIPKLGGAKDSKVIEVLVKPKQKIKKDDPLITLESDKASMDVPSPFSGTVVEIKMKEGDTVSEGDLILSLNVESEEKTVESSNKKEEKPKEQLEDSSKKTVTKETHTAKETNEVYASPFVRRMAHELDIDLKTITGTGNGNRVTLDDMKSFLLKAQPKAVDYSQWGKISFDSLSKIQSVSGRYITEAWQTIPQVTQHHWVDITELEKARVALKVKVTMVSFVMKAMVQCMIKHPVFSRAWVNDQEFALREYYHIGVAVDTGNGLLVPVCRDVDQKDVFQLAKEIKALSEKARDGNISSEDIQGRCASISSLGGIGGGHFTPIVTSPDSFVIGVSKAVYQGIYNEDVIEKRLMLPISLSYDHRLIDGADAARFLVEITQCLMDMSSKV